MKAPFNVYLSALFMLSEVLFGFYIFWQNPRKHYNKVFLAIMMLNAAVNFFTMQLPSIHMAAAVQALSAFSYSIAFCLNGYFLFLLGITIYAPGLTRIKTIKIISPLPAVIGAAVCISDIYFGTGILIKPITGNSFLTYGIVKQTWVLTFIVGIVYAVSLWVYVIIENVRNKKRAVLRQFAVLLVFSVSAVIIAGGIIAHLSDGDTPPYTAVQSITFIIFCVIAVQIMYYRYLFFNEIEKASILEQIQDGLCVINMEGRIVFCNTHFTDTLQLPGVIHVQKTFSDTLYTAIESVIQEKQEFRRLIAQMNEHPSHHYTIRVSYIKNKSVHYVLFYFRPLFDRDIRFLGSIIIARDITEETILKEMMEAKIEERTKELAGVQMKLMQADKLASVGEMAAGVAHEVNNPLNVIMLMTEQLLDDDTITQTEVQTGCRNILGMCNRISDIVGKLLVFARQDMHAIESHDIHPSLDMACTFVASKCSASMIEIHREYDTELPPITLHHEQFQQVIVNILNNAIFALNKKYHNTAVSGVKEICIQTKRIIESNVPLCSIIITDNGAGIQKDALEEIFDPFFTTKGKAQGTGLGLSISHRIISNHGGTISVESEEEKYTRFTIKLPYLSKEQIYSIGRRDGQLMHA